LAFFKNKSESLNKKYYSVLMVCTGNVFRSFITERLLTNYFKSNNFNDIIVSSAGIHANPREVKAIIYDLFRENQIDDSPHTPNKLTKQHLKDFDLIIALANNHKDFILENFGKNVFLYNELLYRNTDSVLDVPDVVKDFESNPKEVSKFIIDSFERFFKETPKLAEKIIELRNNSLQTMTNNDK